MGSERGRAATRAHRTRSWRPGVGPVLRLWARQGGPGGSGPIASAKETPVSEMHSRGPWFPYQRGDDMPRSLVHRRPFALTALTALTGLLIAALAACGSAPTPTPTAT